MDKEKHNGYTNYPTWVLASEIDNNEEMYNFFFNLASAADLTTVYKALEELIKTDNKFMKGVNECLMNYVRENINLAEIARNMIEER